MGSPPSGELSSIRSSGFTVLADAVLLLQQIETTTFLREVYKPAHLTPQQCYGSQRETVPFSIFALELCFHVTFFSQSSLFRPFKNVLNVFLWCCSHMALNYAKKIKFTADENGRKNITCKRTFKHRYEHLFSQTVDGRICSHQLFTSRGDICTSFMFPTRSLEQQGLKYSRLLAKRQQIQKISEKQIRPVDPATPGQLISTNTSISQPILGPDYLPGVGLGFDDGRYI